MIQAPEQELYIQAAAKLAASIAAVLQQKGVCVIGTAGGRSIPGLLERLLAHGHELKGPIHVFWIDERIDSEKNFASALPYFEQLHKEGVLLHWYPITSVHKQQAEVELRRIEAQLQHLGGTFDIVLASAGEDGHVGSIFPHSHILKLHHSGYVFEERSPKPPLVRACVTPQLLLPTHESFLFFVHKQEALKRFMDQRISVEECPAKLLLQRKLTVFTSDQ
jgi:6-phosphogluconolactonase